MASSIGQSNTEASWSLTAAAGTPPPADRCPVCRSAIVVRREGEVVVKNAILRVDASRRVSAKCTRCKTWVEVPLRYIG